MSGDLASTGRILIYQNEKGDTKIDVYFEEDTIWMTQRSMAELYQVTPQNITLHIKNIYEDGELSETATCKNYLQVQTEGSRRVRRDTKFYSLDMILAVGYRVRSGVGIHFRRWASRVLTEYMKKCLMRCSPSTHRTASATLLLPLPLGPTIPVIPLWN